MSERIPVFIYARDPLSQAGIASQLRGRPEVLVVDDETTRAAKALQRNGCPRVVMVITRLDDPGLLAAVEAGACGLLRRSDAVPERLAAAVESAASGDGTVPPDLLGRLLAQMGRLHRQVLAPRGLTFSGLSEREITVLKLVADDLDTAEVANQLFYSERTVKNVIHDVTTRLNLRNRTHAVAYAVRQGLI